jgi:hypothetical protein
LTGASGTSGASGASGASGGYFYFLLTLPPNSYQAKNYVRLNLYPEYTSKLSINGSMLTTSASKLSTGGSEAHHKRSWSSEMMAEQPLGVFALVKSIAERSLWLLTYRLDLGDMGDVGMAIFHFFHRQKMYFERGFILKLVVRDDGGAPVGCFRPCESHGGKEPAGLDLAAGRGGLGGRGDGCFSFFSSPENVF